MFKSFSEKAASTIKILPLLTLSFLSTTNFSMGMEIESSSEAAATQPKYNLVKLFQHIQANQPIPEGIEIVSPKAGPKLLRQHPQPLTTLLRKDEKESWNELVNYIAERDFILSGLVTFQHLSKNQLLSGLSIPKSSWSHHVQAIGALLENQGTNFVTDQRFGVPLHNLLTSRYQITTFASFKSLAQTVLDAKASDPQIKETGDLCQNIIKSYLEEHDLLKKV